MKLLIVLFAIGVIGVIGTIDNAEAYVYSLNMSDIFDPDTCIERSTQYIDILYGDYIYLTNDVTDKLNFTSQEINVSFNKLNEIEVIAFYWFDYENSAYNSTTESAYHHYGIYGANEFKIQYYDYKNDVWYFCYNEIIIRTHLDISVEPDDKWESKYNTCFDKKETIENNLSEYKVKFNTLESKYRLLQSNLNNTEFIIEKLKQKNSELINEKLELIKQVETLETQLEN